MYFTVMTNRQLVIVQSPDCFQHSTGNFVIGQFLLTSWLRGVAAVGPGITLTGEVTAEVAGRFADALERMATTQQDILHDALCGDPGGGKDAFIDFLRGGSFRLVDGQVTRPEDLS